MAGMPSAVRKSAIIVAGGSGRRMGSDVPKQFLQLAGRPMLFHAIGAFHRHDEGTRLIVVLPKDQIGPWEDLCARHGFNVPHVTTSGGGERFHSVQAGLAEVEGEGLVAVHDGARPLVDTTLIERCFLAAAEHGAAIPVVPVSSSVRQVAGNTSKAVDREQLRIVQTPQCFQASVLRRAFAQPYDPAFTDEATLVERMGVEVRLVEGDERNIKVTTPVDLALAEALLRGS